MSEERPLIERIPEVARTYTEERSKQPGLGELEFAGSGGEHIVFRVKQKEGKEGVYRDLLIKAQMHFLRRGIIREALAQRDHLNPDPADRVIQEENRTEDARLDREHMEDGLARERVFFRKLGRFFPKETILRSRGVIRDVPVTPEISQLVLQELELEDYAPKELILIPTIIRYQKSIPEMAKNKQEDGENPDSHSLGFRYVERFNIAPADYARLNQMTQSAEGEMDFNLFSRFLHVGTVRLIEKAKTDPELARVFKELIQKIIAFTDKTHEMLDLAGGGNVRIYKDETGEWKYVFLDPYAGNEWTGARKAVERVRDYRMWIDRREVSDLLNAVNFERTVNGIAKILGITDRIELSSEPEFMGDETSRNLLRLLRSKNNWPDKYEFDDPSPTGEPTIRLDS